MTTYFYSIVLSLILLSVQTLTCQIGIDKSSQSRVNPMTSQSRLVVEGNIFDDTLGNIQPLAIISEKYDGIFNQSQLLDPSTATLNLQTTGTTQQYLCGNKCVKKGVLKLHLHSGGSTNTIVTSNSAWNYSVTLEITPNQVCSALPTPNTITLNIDN